MAKLYFSFSAMNAGKSTILLQASYNYHERGMHTLLLTANLDDRFGSGRISSRIGIHSEASVFDSDTNIFSLVKTEHSITPISCVLIDEAQFLSVLQVWQLTNVVDELNIPVMCYGLRTDFRGELFPGSASLLALADDIREIRTICHCGRKATMVVRQDENGGILTAGTQIEIGGNEKYISLCRLHWKAMMPS